MTVRRLLRPGRPSPPLRLRINGVEVLYAEIAEETEVKFDTDAQNLGDRIPIEFTTDDPVSPTEFGAKDDRPLSVFVGSFSFEVTPK